MKASIILTALIVDFLFVSPLMAEIKTDREKAGLKGSVWTVITTTSDEKSQTTYNPKGDEIEANYTSSRCNGPRYKNIHSYDAQGRRKETVNDGYTHQKTFYTYNAKGELIQHITCDEVGCFNKTVFIYDSRGNLKEEVLYSPSGNYSKLELIHDYDSQGRRIQTTIIEGHMAGQGIEKQVQTFDDKGSIIEDATYYTGSKAGEEKVSEISHPSMGSYTCKYEYDSHGNVIESTSYRTDSKPGDKDAYECPLPCKRVYIYIYDSEGNWTKKSVFRCSQAKSGKDECRELEGITNRAITYYGTDKKNRNLR